MESTPSTGVHQHREHLLVVDDEDHIRFGLSLTLRKVGYRVSVAGNGLEALHYLRLQQHGDQPIALIILDLRMPQLGGPGLLKAMAEEGLHLPVIGISGCLEQEILEPFAQGCQTLMNKPFTAQDILQRIDLALGHGPVPVAPGNEVRS